MIMNRETQIVNVRAISMTYLMMKRRLKSMLNSEYRNYDLVMRSDQTNILMLSPVTIQLTVSKEDLIIMDGISGPFA